MIGSESRRSSLKVFHTKEANKHETKRSSSLQETEKPKGFSMFSWGKKHHDSSKEDLISETKAPSREESSESICQRARAGSIVPDHCTNKDNVTLTDVVTTSYRIRDEIKLTPCEV